MEKNKRNMRFGKKYRSTREYVEKKAGGLGGKKTKVQKKKKTKAWGGGSFPEGTVNNLLWGRVFAGWGGHKQGWRTGCKLIGGELRGGWEKTWEAGGVEVKVLLQSVNAICWSWVVTRVLKLSKRWQNPKKNEGGNCHV